MSDTDRRPDLKKREGIERGTNDAVRAAREGLGREGSNDGWARFFQLVLERLDEHTATLNTMRAQVIETRIEVARLQVKSGIWGMLGGLIPVLLALTLVLLSGCFSTAGQGGGTGGGGVFASLFGGSSAATAAQAAGAGGTAADPFWTIGVVATFCLLGGVVLILTRNLMEGVLAIGLAVGLMVLRAVLQSWGGIILLVGVAAAAWFLGHSCGDLKIRFQANRASRKLQDETRIEESIALKRIAEPWLDARMRKESLQRAHRSLNARMPDPSQTEPGTSNERKAAHDPPESTPSDAMERNPAPPEARHDE